MTDRTASPPQALETVLIEAALSDQTREYTEERALERFYSVADEASVAESSSQSDVALLPRRPNSVRAATAQAAAAGTRKTIKQDSTSAVLAELRKPLTMTESPLSAKTPKPNSIKSLDRRISGVMLDHAATSDFLADLDEDDSRHAAKPKWYWRFRVWNRAWPVIATCCLLLVAALLRRFAENQVIISWSAKTSPLSVHSYVHTPKDLQTLEWWRLCFFLATLAPICWATRLAMRLLVVAVESKLSIAKNTLYFLAAVKKPMVWLLRSLLVLLAFVGIMLPAADSRPSFAHAYNVCVKVFGCAIIFCLANVVKAVLAKRMASHFHREAHFQKMRDAIKKEYYLLALAEPRHNAGVTQPRVEDSAPSACPGAGKKTSLLGFKDMVSGVQLAGRWLPIMGKALSADKPTNLPHRQFLHAPAATTLQPQVSLHVDASNHTPASGLHSEPAQHTAGTHAASAGHQGASPAPDHSSADMLVPPRVQPGAAAAGDAQHMLHSQPLQQPPQPTGQSNWAKLRLAHRTAVRLKPTSASMPVKVTARPEIPPEGGEDLAAALHRVEKHIRKNKLTAGTFSDQVGHSSHADEESTDREARKLAFFLYWNIKPTLERTHIIVEDIEHFMNAKHAAEAFHMLDDDKDGQVSLTDVRNAVSTIFKERANLSLQLKDTKTVVGRLQWVLGVVLHIVAFFIYLIIFNVDLEKVWVMFSSIVLAFAFMFGNSVRTVYESIIYLFVVHPFDVGDKIIVDSVSSKVEEITLNATIVKRSDGGRMWYSNTKLSTSNVINITRSDSKSESLKFMVDISTPATVLDKLSEVLKDHMEKEAAEFKTDSALVSFTAVGDPLKVQLLVCFDYSHNGVDGKRTEKARCGVVVAICKCLVELDITHTLSADRSLHQDREVKL